MVVRAVRLLRVDLSGSGAVARAAHTQHAGYLDPVTVEGEWNPSDFAVQLTRRARGLPFWYSLAVHGTDAYRDAVERRSPSRGPELTSSGPRARRLAGRAGPDGLGVRTPGWAPTTTPRGVPGCSTSRSRSSPLPATRARSARASRSSTRARPWQISLDRRFDALIVTDPRLAAPGLEAHTRRVTMTAVPDLDTLPTTNFADVPDVDPEAVVDPFWLKLQGDSLLPDALHAADHGGPALAGDAGDGGAVDCGLFAGDCSWHLPHVRPAEPPVLSPHS